MYYDFYKNLGNNLQENKIETHKSFIFCSNTYDDTQLLLRSWFDNLTIFASYRFTYQPTHKMFAFFLFRDDFVDDRITHIRPRRGVIVL